MTARIILLAPDGQTMRGTRQDVTVPTHEVRLNVFRRFTPQIRRFDVTTGKHDIDLWVDDEGLLIDSPLMNHPASVIAGKPLAGPAFAAGFDADGSTIGLSDEQIGYIDAILARMPNAVRIL